MRHPHIIPSVSTMRCLRCMEDFRVPTDDMTTADILRKTKTYLCLQCRRIVTDSDIYELEKHGLV